ncbi:hypothetical protein EIP91_001715 [Steccherinum ochraceum]|uniref:Uncharacterized protein n=1 Tax=Steccherinum ochraceum TaxID=92696 RepID=A0A4R0RDJ3_9APHY|nr:hypothetical protein EIP91_001715 [Steccherinum ochraceum]
MTPVLLTEDDNDDDHDDSDVEHDVCLAAHRVAPAINLVSRAFREICLSTGPDLEYVAIRGVRRMVAFTALLASRGRYAKCVRCLFLQVSDTRYRSKTREASARIAEILGAINPASLRVLFIYLSVELFDPEIPNITLPEPLPAVTHLFVSGAVVSASPNPAAISSNLRRPGFTDSRLWKNEVAAAAARLQHLTPSLQHLNLLVAPTMESAAQVIPTLQAARFLSNDAYYKEGRTADPWARTRTTPQPQVVLAFHPCFVNNEDSTFAATTPLRAGLATFKLFEEIPEDVHGILRKDPVVMRRRVDLRPEDEYYENEDEMIEKEFWSDWIACVEGREVSSNMGGDGEVGEEEFIE